MVIHVGAVDDRVKLAAKRADDVGFGHAMDQGLGA